MDKFSYISNAEVAYIDNLYLSFKENPASVDTSWGKFFEGFEFSQIRFGEDAPAQANADNNKIDEKKLLKELNVFRLIKAYRARAHFQSHTNPIRPRKDRQARLNLADFDLSEADLETNFLAAKELGLENAKLKDVVAALKKIYEGPIGFEYAPVRDPIIKDWFINKVEKEFLKYSPAPTQQKRFLAKLNEAVVFENFLHTKYIGQKRFSLEGGEGTIHALDTVINRAADLGMESVVIGMAHRGRLNVLVNTMRKPYDEIFEEFDGTKLLDESEGDGDVKYHQGYHSEIVTPSGKNVSMRLIPNPSHLEAVNPVVEGVSRAQIDAVYNKDKSKVLPILIHGDAAVAGQGIVYETIQMSELSAYDTGGTIHIVINNQVGFTTDFTEARSSNYCADISQILEAPQLHVNGDDAEAVAFVMELAAEYRQKFQRDIFVDVLCYRRYGHNESDEPRFTQPVLYKTIDKHSNPRDIYAHKLVETGVLKQEEVDKMDSDFRNMLQERLTFVRNKAIVVSCHHLEDAWALLRKAEAADFEKSPATSISSDAINAVGKAISNVPNGFKPIKQIEKLLEERNKQFFVDKKLTWASAELLAYGSLLLEGKMVRLTGQDCQRGTFSHRHAVVRDSETNESYNFLNNITPSQDFPFMVHNSLLSEYAVLGFEFGYALTNPNALVLWEAQFGDFANGAQIMIDQFIVSAESKWQKMNGLVMLLPHGYEGQGPEHSNARPERFLQLAAENNIVVTNITTPANFFHLLRRQMTWEFRKPCIVMSPKSLLRHPLVVSDLNEFTEGSFKEIYEDENVKPANKVKRILLCTGKIYYDLLAYQQENKIKDVAIIRVEQLSPFPTKQVKEAIAKYKSQESILWVQEEPENMGAWTYILRLFHKDKVLGNIDVLARKASASPATGFYKLHNKEQAALVEKAFQI